MTDTAERLTPNQHGITACIIGSERSIFDERQDVPMINGAPIHDSFRCRYLGKTRNEDYHRLKTAD